MDGSGEGVRLQKVLAEAGVASRRQAEILMRQGRVEVDGEVVKEMGVRVDPDTAVIHVDGSRIVTDTETVHLALNKPEGMLSTMWDDQGRRCVGDIVLEKAEGQRLFHVGRLDAATEGLLLLTNDGELANRLMHPSYEVPKTYLAEVRAPIPKDLGRQLRAGVEAHRQPPGRRGLARPRGTVDGDHTPQCRVHAPASRTSPAPRSEPHCALRVRALSAAGERRR